jgi:hypothetical protein
VVLALHMLPGFDSEHTYLLLFFLLSAFKPLADMYVTITAIGNTIKPQQIATYLCIFMMCLQRMTTSQRGPGTRMRDPSCG